MANVWPGVYRFAINASVINQALYVVGGFSESQYLASGERHDPREGFWDPVCDLDSFSAKTCADSLPHCTCHKLLMQHVWDCLLCEPNYNDSHTLSVILASVIICFGVIIILG